jgi:arylsulfatase A-like enzyme
MKQIFILAIIVLGTTITIPFSAYSKRKDKRPNIIFLLTDDQRYDALGCMGNNEFKTPNIDKLAEEGILFKNHYNTTAICMASRATVMTGLYEFKSGCNFTHGPLTNERFQKSYPVMLREAGYKTGFTGKFGFAVKDTPDENSSYHSNDDMPMEQFDWWKGWPGQGYYQTEKNEFMVEYADEYPHVSKALGAAAVDFLQESANDDQPFCLSVSFKAPHNPVSPDKAYDAIFADKTYTKPENYGLEGAEHLPQQAKMGRQYTRLFKSWQPEKYDKRLADYYQLIYGVDVAVGMIMDELEKLKLDENTVVIFTTDNGYHCGAHAFGGKVLPYEEGAKGPLIIYGPKKYVKNSGRNSKALTGNIDMYPTILELAGLDIPDNTDGESLVPLMLGKKEKVKDHQLVIQAWGEEASQALTVVTEDMKYIYWYYGKEMEPKEELYLKSADRYEMANKVADKDAQNELQKMHKIYDNYVEFWKKEAVSGNNYEKYGILFDRSVPWSEKEKHLGKEKKSK